LIYLLLLFVLELSSNNMKNDPCVIVDTVVSINFQP